MTRPDTVFTMTNKLDLTPAQEWRRQNLERLIRRLGSLAEISRQADVSEAYLSQIRNRTRAMGNRFAEKLEEGLRLNPGWISREPIGVEDESAAYQVSKSRQQLQKIMDAWPSLTIEQRETLLNLVQQLKQLNSELSASNDASRRFRA